MRSRLALLSILIILGLLHPSLEAAEADEPSLSIRMAPQSVAGNESDVAALAITLLFNGLALKAGEPGLEIPLIASNVDTVATTLRELVIRDRRGPIAFRVQDEERPSRGVGDALGGGRSRQWIFERPSDGPVTVSYVVPGMDPLPPRGAAPPIGLRNDAGGVSGSGSVFLLLPPGDAHYHTDIRWDLSALPQGAKAASSLGPDDQLRAAELSSDDLRSLYFMAGDIGLWARPGGEQGFFAAWQGEPPFGVEQLAAWSGALHAKFRTFFGQRAPAPYGVFLRYNPVNAGGGVGHRQSFVITYGAGRGGDVDKLEITLSHEMFHTFQPFIDGGLTSSWFGEGLAVFYQARLPARFGLITPGAFLDDLNATAGRYYTSSMATLPNSAIPGLFWKDTRARTLPYDRGMLYFATVDHAVRKASRGKRSLDDLMLAMKGLQTQKKALSNTDWERLLDAELGPQAVSAFHDFLGGTMPVPASDAFGPCFRAISKPLRRYELGFEPATLAEQHRVVRGLVAGSAAERAGLKNGDVIVKPVPQDAIQGDQDATLNLLIGRDGREFSIAYKPRGEMIAARQWERDPAVSDAACEL